jgi:hypothetical protein
VLEFSAFYPDGKTASGKIVDTDIWQLQRAIDPHVLYLVATVAIVIAVAIALFAMRRKKTTSELALAARTDLHYETLYLNY